MKFWSRLKILGIFVRVSLDPKRTDLIIEGIDIASRESNHEVLKDVERRVLGNKAFRSMHEENYLAEVPSMDSLKNCPEDSFGRALFKHMDENHLDFDIFPRYETQRPIRYLATRLYQDHDLWHTLLGRGVSVEDELSIQAFAFAQYQSPVALVIIAGGLLNLLRKNPKKSVEAFNKIHGYYELGKQAPFLLSIRLHDLFPRPLAEVLRICQLSSINFKSKL